MQRKAKALLHVAAVLLIHIFTVSFSRVAWRMDTSLVVKELAGNCLNLWSVFAAVYLYTKYVIKISLADVYCRKPLFLRRWCIVAVLLPAAVDMFYLFCVKGTLAFGNPPLQDLLRIFVSNVFGQGIRAAVTEELLYRGLALRALQTGFGKKGAAAASAFTYTLMQCMTMSLLNVKDALPTILGTFLMGTALTLVVCESGSIWSAVLIHALYSIFAGDGQILHIDTNQSFPAIWTYTLETDNWLLIGMPGMNTIYRALPSMLGFLLTGILAIYWMRKADRTGAVCGRERK